MCGRAPSGRAPSTLLAGPDTWHGPALQAMLTLPPGFAPSDWARRWDASVAAACESAAVRSALQRCINIYPSLRVLASIADVAAAAGTLRAGQLSTTALLAAVERQLGQRKAMVGGVPG